MTPRQAYEEGRRQAISPTRFTGDLISLPADAKLHSFWVQGWLANLGSFKEFGEAYYRYIHN